MGSGAGLSGYGSRLCHFLYLWPPTVREKSLFNPLCLHFLTWQEYYLYGTYLIGVILKIK